jgi:hypothetical protein
MLSEQNKKKITEIWDKYVETNREVLDTRGRVISDIDKRRLAAINDIKEIIAGFMRGDVGISEFKTSLDGYNKRNNLWGFTATKGQMFFNQLTKTSDQSIEALTTLLQESIEEPATLSEALQRLEFFEKYVRNIFTAAKDKRKVPNPGSVGYFLSYFWQIHDNHKWPIIYTSLVTAFTELGIWQDHSTQKDTYKFFYDLNEEIKSVLRSHTNHEIENWDAEHAFWNFSGSALAVPVKARAVTPGAVTEVATVEIHANFEISDYIIPKVARLVDLGNEIEKSKASQYEKLVSEIFRQLDFEVEFLGQGSGRNPDAILRFREDHTAFIVDAKAYREGYNLGIDDRAIREYINHYCPKLQREGLKKIGFIIVSNSFKSSFDNFINDITWNTDISRFILLTSEALLYLLAYKTKDKLNLPVIIESLVSMGSLVSASNVIEKFDDI